MLSNRTLAVVKRELKEKLFSKTFLISTILIPVFMVGILGFQTLMMMIEGDNFTQIKVASSNTELLDSLKSQLDKKDFVKENQFSFEYLTIEEGKADSLLSEEKSQILADKYSALIILPDTILADKKVDYYSKSGANESTFSKVGSPLNEALLSIYFKDKEISEQDLDYARSWIDFEKFKVSDEEVKKENFANRAIAMLFSFLLYIALLMLGSVVGRSVIEEKQNRIVEVLLSSASPRELMTGKILGGTITGFVQMFIWMIPLLIQLQTAVFVLPKGIVLELDLWILGYFMLNYIIGMLTYMGLFAAVGAMFDNDQDAQQGMFPIILLIMIPFFMSFALLKNPDNIVANIGSMVPFCSIIVMPARLAIVQVPWWQLTLSFAINIAVVFGIFALAGKIYQIGVLKTGKKPTVKEIIKWLRM